MDKRGHQNNRASRFLSKDEHNNSGHKNQRHQQGGDGVPAGTMTVTVEEFMRFRGHLLTIVKISNGTSFIQAALKRSPQETLHIVKAELLPHAKSLLLDDNAAYTVRLVMDLDPTAALSFFEETASDEEYWVHLCCDSLHTRRLVLYFLASFPDKLQFLFEIAIRHLTTLACNKNGCLTLQKIMSTMPTEMAARAAAECVSQVPQICLDPHGHYLITYLCENGDIEVNIEGICKVISQPATFLSLARNQYGSSTLEKAVRAFPVKFGAALVTGAMGLSDWELIQVANDSFGNYVVQAAVGVPSLDISADLIKRLGTLSGSLTFATKIFRNVTHSTHRGADAAAPPRRQQSGSTRNDSDCLSKSISPTKCVSSETPTERKSPEPTLVFRTDSPPVELMALEKSVSPSVFTSNSMMGLTNSMGVISPPPQANTAALPPQQQQLPVPSQPMMFQHPQHLLAPHQYANAPMPPMMMHPSNPSMYPPMQLAPQFAPAGPNGMMPFMMPSPQLQAPMNHQAPPPGMMMVMTPQGPIMVMPVPPQHQQGFA